MTGKIISHEDNHVRKFNPPTITPEIWENLLELSRASAILHQVVKDNENIFKYSVDDLLKSYEKACENLDDFFSSNPYRR